MSEFTNHDDGETESIPKLEPHPFSAMFPRMLDSAFDALCQNIQIHGLANPIILYQHKILDGVNRYNACVLENVPIRTIDFAGDDLAAFHYVINTNLHRRELTESQRAMCVYDVHQTKGKLRINDPSFTQETLAEKFGISRRMVSYAFNVMRSGDVELIGSVRNGQIPVETAAALLDGDDNLKTRALMQPEEAKNIAKEIKRQERNTKIANKTIVAGEKLGAKLYNVIYSDPPWKFEVYSEETGSDKLADNHYSTMETSAILDLEIPASDDCVMFLWVTIPFLAKGIEVLDHWGFEYKSAWFWDKQNPGTGYWFRNQVEMILVGTKGNISAPIQGEQPQQLISEAKGTHSTKPDTFANEIARLYPTMPKLEMFARKPRPGWDVWGNEVGYKLDEPPAEFVQEQVDKPIESFQQARYDSEDETIEVDIPEAKRSRVRRK